MIQKKSDDLVKAIGTIVNNHVNQLKKYSAPEAEKDYLLKLREHLDKLIAKRETK